MSSFATRAPMKVNCIGGGPAGLYLGILLKARSPRHEVAVYERNRVDDTFGFGVVFSDQTIDHLEKADPESYRQITREFAHWDDIDIHFRGEVIRSTGHGFSGLSRKTLLRILTERAEKLGVQTHFEHPVHDPEDLRDADLVVAADGVNSQVRTRYASTFEPEIDWRPNRFVWLGTTLPFEAFTFHFQHDEHGLWRAHAYRYEEGMSTFIVETTDDTFRRAGLDEVDEEATARFVAEVFGPELQGHPVLTNRSVWRRFPTVKNRRWSHENVTLLGDAAHTAHFSIGSGTKLAMEDAIALADALTEAPTVTDALIEYERDRRPTVDSTQRAAQVSLEWFEQTEAYLDYDPLEFAFSLLTRSLRINHSNLKLRDPELVTRVDTHLAAKAAGQGLAVDPTLPPPPMFLPFRLRELELQNRIVVSPMCMYSAVEGTIDDWHLVHLGSRAMGGAGLVMTEMTDVSDEGRISPGCAGLYTDEHAAAWRRVTDFVHRHTPAKIGIQLGHAGRKAATRVLWEGMDEPLEEGAWPVMAPSPLPYRPRNQTPREMTSADLQRVKEEHVRAVGLALRAGFDLIELHCAHGYLLSTFLSPLTNRRTDAYGGDLTARLRYPLEVFDAMRAAWPADKPMSVRISATDWADGGNDAEEAIEIARAFRAHGVDVVDVSTGQVVSEEKPRYGRLWQTPFSEQIRLAADVPTMTVGAISGYGDANSIIAGGRADLCVLARAHLFDPYWTRHAAYEQGWELEWPKQYQALSRYTHHFD